MSEIVGIGPCWYCKRVFEFDLDTVPSVLIDPATRRPPDVAEDGSPCTPDPAAVARASREPLCPACVTGIEKARAARGLSPGWGQRDG